MGDQRDEPAVEDDLHSVFASLKEHVVEVARDFSERVFRRIDEFAENDRYSRPSILTIFAKTLCQMTNIVAPPGHETPSDTAKLPPWIEQENEE